VQNAVVQFRRPLVKRLGSDMQNDNQYSDALENLMIFYPSPNYMFILFQVQIRRNVGVRDYNL
jgi:hypothetical protein